MILSPVAMLLLGAVCAPAASSTNDSTGPAGSVSREALYRQGIAFDVFLERAVRRRQMWLDNHRKGQAPADVVERARRVPGRWYLLAVAVDGCSDSANILPYLAHLVAAVDGLEMRIIDSEVGRGVMEDHRTPDGRAATPTIVLLDERFEEAGCFIERPRELQEWALRNRNRLDDDEFLRQKFAWYDRDLGRQSMTEIVELMEAAAGGSQNC